MNISMLGAMLIIGGLSYLIFPHDGYYSKRLTCSEAVAVVMVYAGSALVAIFSYIFIIGLL